MKKALFHTILLLARKIVESLQCILKSFRNSVIKQLVYQVCYTSYQLSLYLWRIRPMLKRCRVPKYSDQDYLKILILHSTLSMMIQKAFILLKTAILSKNYQ